MDAISINLEGLTVDTVGVSKYSFLTLGRERQTLRQNLEASKQWLIRARPSPAAIRLDSLLDRSTR